MKPIFLALALSLSLAAFSGCSLKRDLNKIAAAE